MALIKSTNLGGSDLSWLASRRGVDTARTATLKATTFSSYENGIVPAGTPVKAHASDGTYELYTGSSDKLAGFTLNTVSVSDGNEVVALLDHGRVYTDRLPKSFQEPTDKTHQFIFLKGAVD